LRSISKPPVPFELFNEAQTEGMEPFQLDSSTVDYFMSQGIPIGALNTCMSTKKTPFRKGISVID
jgi:hypothetical protein